MRSGGIAPYMCSLSVVAGEWLFTCHSSIMSEGKPRSTRQIRWVHLELAGLDGMEKREITAPVMNQILILQLTCMYSELLKMCTERCFCLHKNCLLSDFSEDWK